MRDKFEALKEKLEELQVKFSLLSPPIKHIIYLSAGTVATEILVLSLDHVIARSQIRLNINKKVYKDLINGKVDFIRAVDEKSKVVFIITRES